MLLGQKKSIDNDFDNIDCAIWICGGCDISIASIYNVCLPHLYLWFLAEELFFNEMKNFDASLENVFDF